jgi:hypothetical protein
LHLYIYFFFFLSLRFWTISQLPTTFICSTHTHTHKTDVPQFVCWEKFSVDEKIS